MYSTIETPTPPFASFRVYPDKKRRFYFRVIVFSTIKQMHAFYREGIHGWPGRRHTDFAAVTLPYECIVGSKESKREIGTILFHRTRVGTGVVSHEMTHAAVHFMKLKGADLNDDKSDEPLAHTIGDLTRQFYTRY